MFLLNRNNILISLALSLALLLYACDPPGGETEIIVDIVDLTGPISIGNTVPLAVIDSTPVNWTSLNSSVATVNSSGLVSGVGIGTANIVATDINDSDNSDTVAVSVVLGSRTITLTPVSPIIDVNETTTVITSTDLPPSVDGTLNWTSSDESFATVTQAGVVTGHSKGMVTITATLAIDATIQGTTTISVQEAVTVLVTPSNTELEVNETQQFSAQVTGGTDTAVTWSVSREDLATINASGLLMATGEGTLTVTATSVEDNTVNGFVTLTITPSTSVDNIEISPPNATILVDSTQILNASVSVSGGAPTTVTWLSSNMTVATVTSVTATTGIVTGLAEGEVTVTATSTFDSMIFGEATITVSELAEIESISIVPQMDTVDVDSTITLMANVIATGGAATTVTWASEDANVTVDATTGVVTGVSVGTAIVSATSTFGTNVVAFATIEVIQPPVVVSISLPPENNLQVGTEISLTAIVSVLGGASETVTWESSNSTIASVSQSGVVTGNAVGTVDIIATSTFDLSKSATTTFTITEAPLADSVLFVQIANPQTTLFVDSTSTFVANVVIQGNASQEITWSSDNDMVVTVDALGLVRANQIGLATITATSDFDPSKFASVEITVTEAPAILSVTVTPSNREIVQGETVILAVSSMSVGGASDDVTWASANESIATVSQFGEVEAISVGTVEITATSDFDSNQFGTVSITVTPKPRVLTVEVALDTALIVAGETTEATATVSAEGGASEAVVWSSSNEGVATVQSTTGATIIINGESQGTATITAISTVDNSVLGEATLTVAVASKVTSVLVTPPTASVNVNETVQLTEILTVTGDASRTVTWTSSDTNVAMVNTTGLVTVVGEGEVTITAQSTATPSVSGSSIVTVINRDPVVDNPIADTTFEQGQTFTIDLTTVFSDPDGDVLTYTVLSNSESVVAVEESNNVLTVTSAAFLGTSNITIIARNSNGNSVSDEFMVTIINAALTVSTPIQDEVRFSGFGSFTIDVSQNFSEDNTNNVLTFSAMSGSTAVATVSFSGSILTITEGTLSGVTIITVTADDGNGGTVSDEFTLTVNIPFSIANEGLLAGFSIQDTINAQNIISLFGEGFASSNLIFAGGFNSSNASGLLYESGGDGTGTTIGLNNNAFIVSAGGGNNIDAQVTELSLNTSYVYIVQILPGDRIDIWLQEGIAISSITGVADATGMITSTNLDGGHTPEYLTVGSGSQHQFSLPSFVGNATEILLFVNQPNLIPQAPTVVSEIADVTQAEGYGSFTVDLSSVFTDANGDALTFTAVSSNPNLATVVVSGTTLPVSEVLKVVVSEKILTVIEVRGTGTTIITVTADDGNGGTVSDDFRLTVTNQAPTVANGIADVIQTETYNSFIVDLSSVFTDGNGDALTFTAESIDPGLATVAVSGTTLLVSEVSGTGTTIITVTADDGNGGTVSDDFVLTVNIFAVFGYRLTASTLNSGSNIIIQLAEGDIFDGDSTIDLLADVTPTGSTPFSTFTLLINFNDGVDDQTLTGLYHSEENSDEKEIQVLGTTALDFPSGTIRIRIVGRDGIQSRNNGIVVTLLDANGDDIGTPSNATSGFVDNNAAHDGFVVDFDATTGAVIRQGILDF